MGNRYTPARTAQTLQWLITETEGGVREKQISGMVLISEPSNKKRLIYKRQKARINIMPRILQRQPFISPS